MESFAFRYACYKEFHWRPQDIDDIDEAEAMRIAVMLEEEARYERKKTKEIERQQASGSSSMGSLPQGFEEDFHFGDGPVDEDEEELTEILYEKDGHW